MLPRDVRMLSSADFTDTVRHGRRIGGPTLVLHVRRSPDPSVRLGFVVSKAVGNAVQRNRVKRRLRHLVAAELTARSRSGRTDWSIERPEPAPARDLFVGDLPAGTRMVFRALPQASEQPQRLIVDFRRAWQRALDGLAT